MTDVFSALPAFTPHREQIAAILSAALTAADPYQAIHAAVERDGDRLTAGGKIYDLDWYERVFILGAGKAAFAMARAAVDLIPDKPLMGGVLVKYLPGDESALTSRRIKVLQGEHPKPGEGSLAGSRELIALANQTDEKDLVLFLLSGGASSLLTSPRSGISLDDMQEMTALLLASGADIVEINTLRKHLDAVKGGGLAGMVYPAELLSLVLSDVVGSPLEVIGSGPTTGDRTTFADALHILEKYHLIGKTPQNILDVLEDGKEGAIEETIRPEDYRLRKVKQILVGSNEKSVTAAVEKAKDLGFHAEILTTELTGEAREQGRQLAQTLRDRSQTMSGPFCLIAGGETTVTIKGKGRGGRNLELALGAVEALDGPSGACLVSLASDGDDGPSGAAGAVVTGEMLARVKELGMDPRDYLDNNDSLTFFEKAGGVIQTGPTGTNVNDFVFLLGNLE